MRKIFFILAMFILVQHSHAEAGPFGTNMGDSPEKYKSAIKMNAIGTYYTKDLPHPHKKFKDYLLFFADKELASVEAQTHTYDVRDIVSEFDELKDSLIKKYGNPSYDEFTDLLSLHPYWMHTKFPSHFGIKYVWFKVKKNDIKSIWLSIERKSSSESSYYIKLEYLYNNFEEYLKFIDKEKERQDKSNLDAL